MAAAWVSPVFLGLLHEALVDHRGNVDFFTFALVAPIAFWADFDLRELPAAEPTEQPR